MKKTICLLLAIALLCTVCFVGCSDKTDPTQKEPTTNAPTTAAPATEPQEAKDWTRTGIFADENGNLLSVVYMAEADAPGWYVGAKLGENMYGRIVPQEGSTLHGNIVTEGEAGEFIVTVSEEGEDGLLLVVDGGETYHFTKYEMPQATIFVTINTEGSGWGMIAYAEGEEAPEIDPEYPYQSAQINLAEPAVYTLAAQPEEGSVFVKWTKDGEDYSTEPQITLELSESADLIAVFEEDPDWQSFVMNYVGEYQCGEAHASVECFGKEDVLITIDRANSESELVRWIILGRLDEETLTVSYSDSSKIVLTYNEAGEVTNEEIVYEDGTGTVTFHNDRTFTWHEDASETGEDLIFEWAPVSAEE